MPLFSNLSGRHPVGGASAASIRRVLQVLSAILLSAGVAGAQQAPLVDPAQLMKDVEVLAADDMEGREVETRGGEKARAYLVSRFREIGVQPFGAYERPFRFVDRRSGRDRQGTNLLGFVRGTSAAARFVVVTAHYDHIGIQGGAVYNGADDNASGVAALLAVAAFFTRHPPEHSLLLAALDAEEVGLQGARALLADPPVSRDQFVVNVNLDMLGRDRANRLYAVGTRHYPFLRPHLEGVAQPPVTLIFGHDAPGARGQDWTQDSDHFAFHQAGIPFVYFGVEDYEHHHKPTDDATTIMREFFAGATATVIAAIRSLDTKMGK